MVLECWDRVTKSFVAMKIIRSFEKYTAAAMLEVSKDGNVVPNAIAIAMLLVFILNFDLNFMLVLETILC